MSEKNITDDGASLSKVSSLTDENLKPAEKRKFEKICKDAGLCDAKGIQRMLKIYEISLLKESSPELSQQTENMERAIDQIQRTYMQTVKISEKAEERIDSREAEILEQAHEEIMKIEFEKNEAVELQHEAEQKLQETVKDKEDALREWERKYNDLIAQNRSLKAKASQLQTELKEMSKSAHDRNYDGAHSENAENRIAKLVEQMQEETESAEVKQYRETQIELKAKLEEMTQKYDDMTDRYRHAVEEKDRASDTVKAQLEAENSLIHENEKLKERNAMLAQQAARVQEIERLNLQMQSILQAGHK